MWENMFVGSGPCPNRETGFPEPWGRAKASRETVSFVRAVEEERTSPRDESFQHLLY